MKPITNSCEIDKPKDLSISTRRPNSRSELRGISAKSPSSLTHGLTAAKLNPGLAEANAPADLQLIARAPLTAPPQNPLPAEGPLLQPSLALNIDTAQLTNTTLSTHLSPPPPRPHAFISPRQKPQRLHLIKAQSPRLYLIQLNRTPACISSSHRLLYLFKSRGHPVAAAANVSSPFI